MPSFASPFGSDHKKQGHTEMLLRLAVSVALLGAPAPSISASERTNPVSLRCDGEVWLRDGEVLKGHYELSIDVVIDIVGKKLRVQSPLKVDGWVGSDQSIVMETPTKYFMITDRDLANRIAKGEATVGSPVTYNSTLDRVSGELILMEGSFFEGPRSSFNGNCVQSTPRF
jgi:hypothetical protein